VGYKINEIFTFFRTSNDSRSGKMAVPPAVGYTPSEPPAARLPYWLPGPTLSNLACGPARLSLRFWREGEASRWQVAQQGRMKH
jgi:hypothetical protein